MIAPFDLFRTEADGSVKWLGVCADLDAAKVRVVELSVALPGEYFIFSQTTERRLFIKPDGQVSERENIEKVNDKDGRHFCVSDEPDAAREGETSLWDSSPVQNYSLLAPSITIEFIR